MRLPSKSGVPILQKDQALAMMLLFSCLPPCQNSLHSFLQDGSYTAPPSFQGSASAKATSLCFTRSPFSGSDLHVTGTLRLKLPQDPQLCLGLHQAGHQHYFQCDMCYFAGVITHFAGTYCFASIIFFAGTLCFARLLALLPVLFRLGTSHFVSILCFASRLPLQLAGSAAPASLQSLVCSP